MSSLRKYQQDPQKLLNYALNLYRSKKIKTVIVEGVCDKRFLMQWTKKNAQIRFDGLDGKPLVKQAFEKSQQKPYADHDFLYFFVDVDYDVIVGRQLTNHPRFVYNVYCFDSKKLAYNDLETFLVNASALEKVMANLDIDLQNCDELRKRLERASRIIGSFRAADELLQAKHKLRSSVLNGIELRAFFKPKEFYVDVEFLKASLPKWSNYPLYTDDLINIAVNLNRDTSASWALSRGHDITEMLYLYLESIDKKGLSREKIELMLRLACEASTYCESPMGKRLVKAASDCFLALSEG